MADIAQANDTATGGKADRRELLIGLGCAALLIAIWQYHAMARYLLSKEFEPIAGIGEVVRHTPLYAIAFLMVFIGLFALGAVFIRV